MTNRKDPNNTVERLTKALENIATCEGTACDRAKWAALDLAPLLEEDFPEQEQRDHLRYIRTGSMLLQSTNPPDETAAQAVIEHIWKLYWAMSANQLYR